MSFPCKTPFPLATAKLIGDVLTFFDHFTPSIRFIYSNGIGGNNRFAPICKADQICRITIETLVFFWGTSLIQKVNQFPVSLFWKYVSKFTVDVAFWRCPRIKAIMLLETHATIPIKRRLWNWISRHNCYTALCNLWNYPFRWNNMNSLPFFVL